MKRHKWLVFTAVALTASSIMLYAGRYAAYGDSKAMFMLLLDNLAFLPLQVLLVVLIIERVLSIHERSQLLQKLNMVIGTFFSELGSRLLGELTNCVRNQDEVRKRLSVNSNWTANNYRNSLLFVKTFDYKIDLSAPGLDGLREMLLDKRGLIIMLLANPNLLEHERFTDLLWAVEHLMEELAARSSLDNLPDSDRQHLAGDVQRVYALLTAEWLLYCQHLQCAYPYIFSIIVRTHPLQANPSPTVV